MTTYYSNEQQAQATWRALCIKNGMPDAANLTAPTATTRDNDLHEIRKTARRAVNAITATMKPADYDNETTDGLAYAGAIIQKVNQTFERQQDAEHFFGKKQANNVLRTPADFENHYGKKPHDSNEQPYGLDDFLRGVAGLRSSEGVKK